MGFFGAVSVRLKASVRSTDLLNLMKRSSNVDKKAFLLEQPNVSSFSIDENWDWPDIFCEIIWEQLSIEYAKKGKSLGSEDVPIVIQAVGNALSEWYPNDESVKQFLSTLPFGV